MTLRTKFILFAVFVHSLLAILTWYLLQQNKWMFLGMELLILVSVLVTVQLYRSFFKPLNLIRAGIESIKDKDFSTTFTAVGQRDLDDLVNVYNRMIHQLRQERVAQAEKNFLLEKLIQASPAGIILLGFDNQVEGLNPAAERYLGKKLADLQGCHLSQLPETWASQLQQLPTGQSVTFRVNGTWTYRCHRAHFLDRGFQHYFILIEELTEAILHNERQAYEKVIRVMSHEVNNTTGAINSIFGSLQYYAPQLTPHDRPDFEHVLQVATDRNTNLSRFMANFADVVRLPQPRKEPTHVQELLTDLQRLIKPELDRRQITLHWHPAPQPIFANLDRQQMEQVLLNILKNAMEAIGSEGEITIEAVATPPHISITDNGGGIPADIKQHLFTPFYTSKKTGQGIGLTMVRDILMNHGFTFSLSDTGNGLTSFIINLHQQ
ncbi:sensor histidine kinase [Pontibacter oryzae]|uniref:histidine kinase n=1 Tax=Pontibacter oryzae TaxID=2304593 RepID=A0A399RR84_9BACT|nr:ATP-binding protein [Pontibacter oryzae]RIJ34360.1 histidine kinase [Pontibacter oryzae]